MCIHRWFCDPKRHMHHETTYCGMRACNEGFCETPAIYDLCTECKSLFAVSQSTKSNRPMHGSKTKRSNVAPPTSPMDISPVKGVNTNQANIANFFGAPSQAQDDGDIDMSYDGDDTQMDTQKDTQKSTQQGDQNVKRKASDFDDTDGLGDGDRVTKQSRAGDGYRIVNKLGDRKALPVLRLFGGRK